MTPEELLSALRADGIEAGPARDALVFTTLAKEGATAETAETADTSHGTARAAVAALMAGSLHEADRPLARWLLAQEIAAHEAAGQGASEAIYTLVAAVARYADPADVLLIWRARETTPDTRSGVDAEQALRAGVERVRRRLRTLIQRSGPRAAEARQALEWLEQSIATGAAEDLPGYFAWSDERFGLHVSGPT